MMNIKKTIIGTAFVLSLSTLMACAHYIENPYNGMSSHQLKNISSADLCSVATDSRYKINSNVISEVTRRGFKDCSSSEVYCLSNLSLKPGSTAFATCRLTRDQYELNVKSQQMAYYMGLQQLEVQREAVATMRAPQMVMHSGSIDVNHNGYMNQSIH